MRCLFYALPVILVCALAIAEMPAGYESLAPLAGDEAAYVAELRRLAEAATPGPWHAATGAALQTDAGIPARSTRQERKRAAPPQGLPARSCHSARLPGTDAVSGFATTPAPRAGPRTSMSVSRIRAATSWISTLAT